MTDRRDDVRPDPPADSDAGTSVDVPGTGIAIPRAELQYRATRAGGPGGQHVNTSATRIELTWNVDASVALSAEQRALLRERLATRIDGQGSIRVVASRHRSQHRNREDATERLRTLLADALAPRKPRQRTRTPQRAREARLAEKKRRARIKEQRRPPEPE